MQIEITLCSTEKRGLKSKIGKTYKALSEISKQF